MSSETKWVMNDEPGICFKEGFRFFVKHVGTRYENPYTAGSDSHFAYLAGWRCGVSSFSTAIKAVRGVQPPSLPVSVSKRLPAMRAH